MYRGGAASSVGAGVTASVSVGDPMGMGGVMSLENAREPVVKSATGINASRTRWSKVLFI
jgi:hypothetical protein